MMQRKWKGLIILLIFSFIINQLLLDVKVYIKLDNKIKDLAESIIIFTIYLIGKWGLADSSKMWLLKLWQFIYFSSLVFFIVMFLIDWFIYHYTYKEQYRFLSIKQVLWNPLTYLVFIAFEELERLTDNRKKV